MKVLIVILAAVSIACALGCESIQTVPSRDEAPLEYGKYLYEAKCQSCHELYDPQHFRQRTLRRYVRKYAAESGLKRDDRPYVVDYLVANARDAE